MTPVEIILPKKRITRQVPAAWDSLTRRQLTQVAGWLFAPVPPAVMKMRLLAVVLRVPALRLWSWLNPVQLAQCFDLVKFLLDDNKLTVQLIPSVRLPVVAIRLKPFRILPGPPVRLHGPSSRLGNLTYEELVFADSLFLSYHAKPDPATLDKLCAVLYRPAAPGGAERGDNRRPFNRNLIEADAKLTARMPLNVKLAAYLFYQGCRKALVSMYPDVFDGEGAESRTLNAWMEMSRHIPSDKFGTIHEIMTLNMHFVLLHLNGTISDTKKIKPAAETF